ncbi:CASP-like protein [Dendrobium catenatum]|uniref:CASP-like protein n=1 Tax=Dendrobium catenatum TaxID=906689 RepID=A0A2I0W674_9ASPA|nr:CASP-like protein [Dendrobium catenatum]
MPSPTDIAFTFHTFPKPARALTVHSKTTPLAKPAPPPDYFVVNILALLKLIAGLKLTETAVTSPAPSKAVKTSPAPAPPEFSVVEIPNWEISATTSAVPEVSATTLVPSEVIITTAPPPAKTTDSLNVRKHSMRVVQIIVRNLAAMATLTASIIMLFNEEQIHLSGFQLTANYKFSPAFKFFVIGNGFACIYAFASMIIIICYGSNLAMHFLDTLVMGLVIAAAAATAVSYIGNKGNANASWQPVCNHAEDYCYHSTVSIACSYLGFLLLLLVFTLTFMSKLSIYNLSME